MGTSTITGQTFEQIVELPPNYHDIRLEWIDAATIKILAGSRCRDEANTRDIRFNGDYFIDMTNATPTSISGGRTVAESASTQYFLYVGLDTSGVLPLAWLDTADLSDGDTVTYPAAYGTGVRQVLVNGIQNEQLSVFNDAGSNIDYMGGSVIALFGGSGYGSTNTRIRRYTTINRNIGKALSLAQSATLGDSITINKNGIYVARCSDQQTTAVSTRNGISLNSNQLSTDVDAITARNIVTGGFTSNTTYIGIGNYCTRPLYLKAGDILRGHTGGQPDGTSTAFIRLEVVRVG